MPPFLPSSSLFLWHSFSFFPLFPPRGDANKEVSSLHAAFSSFSFFLIAFLFGASGPRGTSSPFPPPFSLVPFWGFTRNKSGSRDEGTIGPFSPSPPPFLLFSFPFYGAELIRGNRVFLFLLPVPRWGVSSPPFFFGMDLFFFPSSELET